MTPNHCYMGANKIDLTKDTNTVYTHPSSIQCNASSEINNLKSSVSNGKSLIASAITGKGVSTASNATFQTMANNISSITTKRSISVSSVTSDYLLYKISVMVSMNYPLEAKLKSVTDSQIVIALWSTSGSHQYEFTAVYIKLE